MATILVVEDTETVRVAVCRILKRAGHCAVQACNGMEAVEYLVANHGNVDLIISDLRMPFMDGLGLLEWLVGAFPDAHSKFIFHTGSSEEIDKSPFPKTRRIDKPCDPSQFMSTVLEALKA